MSKLVFEKGEMLPKNWINTTIGEIIEPSTEKLEPKNSMETAFIGLEHIESNSGKIIGGGSSKDVKSTKSVFHGGDILYGKLRPYLNKVAVPKFDGVCSTDILVFPKNKYLDSNYVFLFLTRREFVTFANSTSSGVQHPRTSFEKISSFRFPLSPLNEQKRIVAKIEEIFLKFNFTMKLLNKIKLQLIQYRQSVLKSAFIQYEYKKPLSECGTLGTGGTPLRNKPAYYGGTIPWVKTTEVKDSHIKGTEESITRDGIENSNAKIYPVNSVVLAMYGEGKTRGKTAILDIPAATNQACAVIVCEPKVLNYKYCFYWLQSQYHEIRSKSSGGNQPNLNLRIIKKLEIPLSDIEKQKIIVSKIESRFSQIDFLQQILENMFIESSLLINSLLKQAFEGKLVPQDPNDEPVEILLQKIKQEKQKIISQTPKLRKKDGK